MDIVTVKLICAFCLLCFGLLGASAAQFIKGKFPHAMQVCNALAGGVLISVALVHMLSENSAGLETWGVAFVRFFGAGCAEEGKMGGEGGSANATVPEAAVGAAKVRRLEDEDCEPFPVGFALFLAGMFLILSIEVCGGGHSHGHSDSEKKPSGAGGGGHSHGLSHSDEEHSEATGSSQEDEEESDRIRARSGGCGGGRLVRQEQGSRERLEADEEVVKEEPLVLPLAPPKPRLSAPGCYLWGEVGRGKTLMMDLFALSLQQPHGVANEGVVVRRAHFHDFMHGVHQRIGKLRSEGSRAGVSAVVDETAAGGPASENSHNS